MNPKRIEIKDNGHKIRVAHAAGIDEFPYRSWERDAQLKLAKNWANRLRRAAPAGIVVIDHTEKSRERVSVRR